MPNRVIPILELILASAIWGFAFVAQRKGNESLHPLLFNGLRFALGGILLLCLLWLRSFRGDQRPGREVLRSEKPELPKLQVLLLGSVLFIAASLQQIGLLWTSAGNAGFITGLYVVFVPLIGLWRSQKPGRSIIVAVLFAVAGLWLINRGSSIDATFGNMLVLISALFWALHVQLIDRLTKRFPSFILAIWQYLVCALLSLLCWGLGSLTGQIGKHSLQALGSGVRTAVLPLLYGGLASVGIAYTLQLHAQKSVAPAPASIILCLEAVFAMLGGWLLLSEGLSVYSLSGAGFLLAAMLISVFTVGTKTSTPKDRVPFQASAD
jgi:drug/metabolite transporter (DMT)-like permease